MTGPKGRRPKKKTNYMAQADVLFSKWIRLRDACCLRCGSTDRLQCAHIISRSYKSVRVDSRNAVALCQRCHVYFTHRPLEWDRWVGVHFPGRLRVLREEALGYGRVDWKGQVADLKARVEEWS